MGLLTSWYMAVMVALVNAMRCGAAGRRVRTARTDKAWGRRAVHLAAAAVIAGAVVYPMARPYVGLRANPAEAAAFSADRRGLSRAAGEHARRAVVARQRRHAAPVDLRRDDALRGMGCHRPWAPRARRARHGPARAEARVGVSAARGRGGFLLSLGTVPPLLGRTGAGAVWLAGEPAGLLRHAGARAVRARVHAGAGRDWRRLARRGCRRGRGDVGPWSWRRWFRSCCSSGSWWTSPPASPKCTRFPRFTGRPRSARRARSRRCPSIATGRTGSWAATTCITRPRTGGRSSTGSDAASRRISPRSIAQIRAFASDPAAVAALGVQYVIVHAERLGARGSRHHRCGQGESPHSARRPDRIGLPVRDRHGRLMPSRTAARRRRIRARRRTCAPSRVGTSGRGAESPDPARRER